MRRLFLLTPEAKSDLEQILLDIAEDSPDTAERLRQEFYEGLQSLGRLPGIGHYHDELLSRKYRFWNFYSYVVAYVWEARPIQVISVVHGARDLAVFFNLRVGQDT
ncbi:MAG: type II toxin-antitoxin system RelE/ParE family toxin [Bryobacteraceae bacterium]|nr:type II toxin-antitoxin system RelE/ParE family toxin [Bryobacteraceae bacterium]